MRVPTLLECGVMIFAARSGLRLWGFGRVTRWITERVRHIAVTGEPDAGWVREVERLVATAGALYPGRARCLEQSLVLYYLLRRRGVGVRYCHGVIARPFEAHAWIEYRGEVVNDIPEHVGAFARLPVPLP